MQKSAMDAVPETAVDTRLEEALRSHLSMRALLGADMPIARLVLALGVPRGGAAFKGRRMQPKACFRNAAVYAERHGMLYEEGYALSGRLAACGIVLPVEHAWCVDANGMAVDPTWEEPETSLYLGVSFRPREVMDRVARKGTFGMFQSGRAGLDDREFLESLLPGLNPGEVDPAYVPEGVGLPKL